MSYRTTNRQTINNAFKTFNLRIESYVEEGMLKMAQAGLEYLIEAHEIDSAYDPDKEELDHQHQSNTTAWAIAHNGRVVKAAYYDGDKGSGIQERALSPDAMQVASRIAAGTSGWTICITADMKGWYREDYERVFMNYSRDQIMNHFHDYFKPVK